LHTVIGDRGGTPCPPSRAAWGGFAGNILVEARLSPESTNNDGILDIHILLSDLQARKSDGEEGGPNWNAGV